MLTDVGLRNLRAKSKSYKMTDRDGLYVLISPSGGVAFKYDYRFNGRRETLTLGAYGPAGLSLAKAREKVIDAKRLIAEGVSPAPEKQRAKRRLKEAQSFEQVAQRWMDHAPMADSTRNMRRSIFNREVLPEWRNRLLNEITPNDLRAHCATIVDRGGASDRHPCPRHRQTDLSLCHPAWREDRQPGRRRRPFVDCDFPSPRSRALAVRDPDHARRANACRDVADDPPGVKVRPAQHGPQKRFRTGSGTRSISTTPSGRSRKSG